MAARGSCLCGEIQYTVDGDIGAPGYCHCTMCQKMHGAPFGVYSRVAWDEFTVTKGEDLLEVYASSPGINRTFCRQCGSTLQFIRVGQPSFGLTPTSLDTPFETQPDEQIFTADKAAWFTLAEEPRSWKELPDAGD